MEVEPIRVQVVLDHEEADRRVRNLAATATGLRVACERLDQHLTELEKRADKLAKLGVPDAARGVAKAAKSRG